MMPRQMAMGEEDGKRDFGLSALNVRTLTWCMIQDQELTPPQPLATEMAT